MYVAIFSAQSQSIPNTGTGFFSYRFQTVGLFGEKQLHTFLQRKPFICRRFFLPITTLHVLFSRQHSRLLC